MPINKSELTKEQIAKAMSCETAEELMVLAKTEGVELTKEEAEAYMAELEDYELDEDMLKNVAGCWCLKKRRYFTMGKINMNELTKEQIQKAMACESVEELIELAKSEGIELTKEEAEAYMAEMEDVELDSDALKQVAGGMCYSAGMGSDERCNRGGGITGA